MVRDGGSPTGCDMGLPLSSLLLPSHIDADMADSLLQRLRLHLCQLAKTKQER
jgi:hypothetical protein